MDYQKFIHHLAIARSWNDYYRQSKELGSYYSTWCEYFMRTYYPYHHGYSFFDKICSRHSIKIKGGLK